ncbi:MAG: diguanylate cyclase [Chromatiaceae bacterium]|nr:diguanylate cyclase [Chromatiaceae bacterium]
MLDSLPEERLDRITRIAKGLFDVPIALITLVDQGHQSIKSLQGLEELETTPDMSFCAHAVMGSGVFVIPDALEDERFRESPLVTGETGIRFFAGYPFESSTGDKLGALCIMDQVARDLREDEEAALRDLANVVEDELAALQLITVDELTQISNRRGFELYSSYALEMCRRLDESAALIYLTLGGLQQINDDLGASEGDLTLKEFALALTKTFRICDVLGRIDGDGFAVLVTGASEEGTASAVGRMEQLLKDREIRSARSYDIQFSVEVVSFNPSQHRNVAELIGVATERMNGK